MEVNEIPIVSEHSIVEFIKTILSMDDQPGKTFKLKILRAGKVQETILRFADEYGCGI